MNANQAHLLQVLLHHIEKKPELRALAEKETGIKNLEQVIKYDLRPAVEKHLCGPMS